MTIAFRSATLEDAPAIALLLRQTMKHDKPYLPEVHTPVEDLEFIVEGVLPQLSVVVAEGAGEVIGFCGYKEGALDHLYIHPNFQRQGIGSELLERAKVGIGLLRLWVFQKNQGAREFYERHGFTLELLTDGTSNEQKEPDACYFWRRESEMIG